MWVSPEQPFGRVHIDFAGPFQGKLLLVLVDAFSKWAEAAFVPSTSSQAAIDVLRTWFATHGLPDTVVSDNGTAFVSALFQDFLMGNGIHHMRIAPFHPDSNGQAERAVQMVKQGL